MLRRPKKIEIRPVDTYRRPIPNAYSMQAFLSDTVERGYHTVYFVRAKDLLEPEVKQALEKESRCRLVRLETADLLPVAYQWLRDRGGLAIWTTLYGSLARIEV